MQRNGFEPLWGDRFSPLGGQIFPLGGDRFSPIKMRQLKSVGETIAVAKDNRTKGDQSQKANALIARQTPAQNLIVTRHNSVNDYAIPLTLNEHRLLAFYMATIDPQNPDTWKVSVPLKDFISAFGLESHRQYKLAEEIKALKRDTEIRLVSEKVNLSVSLFYLAGIVSHCGQTYLQLYGSEAIKYYFNFADGNYTEYRLSSVVAFSTPYQYVLYNILRQNAYIGKLTLSVAELHEYLNIGASTYPQWKDFKKRVLLPTQEKICQFSDIVFTFNRIRGSDLVVFDIRQKKDGWTITQDKNGNRALTENIAVLPSGTAPGLQVCGSHYLRMLGITRKPGKIQQQILLSWEEQKIPDDMIIEAKVISIQNIGKVTIEYVNGILKNTIQSDREYSTAPETDSTAESIAISQRQMRAFLQEGKR